MGIGERAPIAQWIEHWSPEPEAEVRSLLGVPPTPLVTPLTDSLRVTQSGWAEGIALAQTVETHDPERNEAATSSADDPDRAAALSQQLETSLGAIIDDLELADEADVNPADDGEAATTRTRHHVAVGVLLHALLRDRLRAWPDAERLREACVESLGLPEDLDPDGTIDIDAGLQGIDPETFAFAAGALTSPESRKSKGVVLTPPDVARLMAVLGLAQLAERRHPSEAAATWVRRILSSEHQTELADAPLTSVRVLDPAGGTGTFLIAAARILESCARERDPAIDAIDIRTDLLRDSLHAFEQSATTVLLARFSLLLFWLDAIPRTDDAGSLAAGLPDLRANIRCADPLTQRFSDDEPLPKKIWKKWLDESYALTQKR